jgi:DNA helicase-2/ATP-dependent DNA helicase PcrA
VPGEVTAFTSPFQQPKAMEPYITPVEQTTAPPADMADMPDLKAGMKVRHDRFGIGEIIAVEGNGGNTKATVRFVNFGQKQLLLKFARLTITE